MGMGAFGVWEKANQLAAQGKQLVRLEIGEPDFATPDHIVKAAEQSIRKGRTTYGNSAGEPRLREAIAAYLARSRNIETAWQNIMVTPGVKGALFFTAMMLLDPGDEVLVPTPGYPPYNEVVAFAGGKSVSYQLKEADGFQIDSAEILSKITAKTKMIILNSPSNPTGTLLSRASLEKVAAIAEAHDLWIVSDEVYFQIYFTDDRPISIYELPNMPQRTILLDGFSKAYAMTGWRLGFAVVPDYMTASFAKMMVTDHSNLPLFIQDAGYAALTESQVCVAEMVAAYRHRRDLTMARLATMPIVDAIFPDSSFYVLINIEKTGESAQCIGDKLLDAGVALLPQGETHLRMAFVQSQASIERALDLMGPFFAQYE